MNEILILGSILLIIIILLIIGLYVCNKGIKYLDCLEEEIIKITKENN